MAQNRQIFAKEGKKVYEWEQNINEVLVFVKPPEGVTARMISCKILPNKVTLGISGNPPFLDNDLFDIVVEGESFWTMDNGEIEINLQKMKKAQTWESVFKGHGNLDAFAVNEVQKQMTLERFQEEHGGFDFSGAEFNGAPPDPRTFLDGVPYK